MPLLEPITFFSAPVRGAITPEKAEDMSLGLFSPSPETRSMMYSPQPLVIPSGISSLSRSDPPTPPRGPPPTPRRRAHNELSKSDPPTPPRAPPPTPRRRDVDMFDSLSRRDLPCPPTGLLPAHRRHEADMLSLLFHCEPSSPISGLLPTSGRSDSLGDFNSFSRRDPPTPPGGPPPSPCRRGIFNDLSRCDPPTPPSGPPPSPQRRGVEIYTDLSRSSPPSPPRGPPPTPAKGFRGYNTWTTDETNLLTFVCRSGVKLGWYQIAGLFHGKDVDECRRKYREIQSSEETLFNQQKKEGCDSDDSRSCEPLQLRIPTDAPVPGLSRGPSPVGSPEYCRLTIKSWELNSDVECAVDFEIPKKKKTIVHLSDELNFALEKGWDNVMDRVQGQHAFSQYSTGAYWTIAPGFLQMTE